MAKRIVEETLSNGEIRYSVQENTFCGIPCRWHTMAYLDDDDACICHEATFDAIDKAIRFCGIDKQVVNSKVLGIKPICVKDMMSKDKLAEDELINLRGALTLLCNRYKKRIRVEEYKAIEVVRKFIDRMLGV